jgi:hypothetical protein
MMVLSRMEGREERKSKEDKENGNKTKQNIEPKK